MKIDIRQIQALHQQGKRENNEDNIYPVLGNATPQTDLFLVCDGVGGAEKGEVASAIVCSAIPAYFGQHKNDDMNAGYILAAFKYAQSEIDHYLAEHPESSGMATTLTLLSVNQKGATMAWCGDSRVYQIRNNKIIFKTEDHSFVAELVRNNIITAEAAKTHPQRNQITRAMQGSKRDTYPDVAHQTDVKEGDWFFMCTDGILESVSDEDLVECIKSSPDAGAALNAIYQMCEQKSRDNFSCYLIQIGAVEGQGMPFPDFDPNQTNEKPQETKPVDDSVPPVTNPSNGPVPQPITESQPVYSATVIPENKAEHPKNTQPKHRKISLFLQVCIGVLLLGLTAFVVSNFVGNSDSSIVLPGGDDKDNAKKTELPKAVKDEYNALLERDKKDHKSLAEAEKLLKSDEVKKGYEKEIEKLLTDLNALRIANESLSAIETSLKKANRIELSPSKKQKILDAYKEISTSLGTISDAGKSHYAIWIKEIDETCQDKIKIAEKLKESPTFLEAATNVASQAGANPDSVPPK